MWEPENVARGTRSVHSSKCAHRRLSGAGRAPPPGHTGASRLLRKTLFGEARDPYNPPFQFIHTSSPWPQHPPICPIWCHLAPQASCQSKLRLAGKSTFLDTETVQATRAWGIPGHLGTLASPPLRSLLLEPRALPWGWGNLAD